jgi:hypothetical protein
MHQWRPASEWLYLGYPGVVSLVALAASTRIG